MASSRLLNVSVLVAFTAGVSYAFVAVPAQTALQEELPEDVRGRVFGVLNTLVSLASFLPIIIVGPVADVIGPTSVIMMSAAVVFVTAISSIFLSPEMDATGEPSETYQPVDPMTVATQSTSLTQPVRLRYVEPTGGPSPIDYDGLPGGPGAGPGPAEPAPAGQRREPPAGRVSARPTVIAIFTGGTISMLPDPATGAASPALDGAAILHRTPGLDAIANVEAIDWGLVPASHLSFPQLLEIADLLRAALDRPTVSGAVVVQGTDVMEETAFAFDLLVDSPKPVVVVGAMRSRGRSGL